VASGSVLNVANGEPVEVRELIAMLAEELGLEPIIDRRPPRVGDTPRTEGCADAARAALCWTPGTDLRSGLRRQVEWHLRQRIAARSAAPALAGPRVPADPIGVGVAVGNDELVQGMQ
jgi:nucleoside-diphosphate-sugar epimerase